MIDWGSFWIGVLATYAVSSVAVIFVAAFINAGKGR